MGFHVSLYLYYIIKFHVVPETNHTGAAPSVLETNGPSKEREETEKGTESLPTETRTQDEGQKDEAGR